MTFHIYQITNLVNQKVYIGQTIEPLARRWARHLATNSGCVKLRRAITKYGKDNFSIILIEDCHSQEEADARETHWIAELQSITLGYNICAGGRTGGTRGPHSESAKRKISQANSGSGNGMYGRPAVNRGQPGTRLGVRKIVPLQTIKDIQDLHRLGFSYSELARHYHFARLTIRNYCTKPELYTCSVSVTMLENMS